MQSARHFGLRWIALASLVALLAARQSAHATQGTTAFRQFTRASWYGNDFLGRRMASGKQFDPQGLTAAHPTLNLGSRVKVTDVRTGRSVIVRITDRGPYLPGRGIDLSYAAAQALGIVRRGVAQVRVDLINHDEPPASPPIVTAMWGPTLAWLPKAIVK